MRRSTRITALSVAAALAVGGGLTAIAANAATNTYTPTSDTMVSSGAPTTNYSTQHRLWAVGGGSLTRISYVTFNTPALGTGCTVDSATLKVTVGPDSTNGSAVSGGLANKVTGVADDTTVWNTRPALGGALSSSEIPGPVAIGAVENFDVTGAVPAAGGAWSVALTSTSTDDIVFNSKEVVTPAQIPTLTLNSSCTTATPTPTPTITPPAVPKWDHVVIVVEENHSFTQTNTLPYISSLAAQGVNFTNFHGETHPSAPNYQAMWSGSQQGMTTDACPVGPFTAPSLGSQLAAAGKTYQGLMEGLPADGSLVCSDSVGAYVRNHNPLANFASDAGAATNRAFTHWPTDYSTLPSVTLISPSLRNDMHNGTLAAADTWLQTKMDGYVQWAKTHNSLFILTTDENDGTAGNQITNIYVGAHVPSGVAVSTSYNHYNQLSTLEDAFGVSHLNAAPAITGIYN